ncbi:MAG: hypothetical protein ACREB6_10585 [Rhodospirillales bacterium]
MTNRMTALTDAGRPSPTRRLRNRIGMARVNQKVDPQVVRNGKVLTVTAKIAPRER